jgi:hypothetical protein
MVSEAASMMLLVAFLIALVQPPEPPQVVAQLPTWAGPSAILAPGAGGDEVVWIHRTHMQGVPTCRTLNLGASRAVSNEAAAKTILLAHDEDHTMKVVDLRRYKAVGTARGVAAAWWAGDQVMTVRHPSSVNGEQAIYRGSARVGRVKEHQIIEVSECGRYAVGEKDDAYWLLEIGSWTPFQSRSITKLPLPSDREPGTIPSIHPVPNSERILLTLPSIELAPVYILEKGRLMRAEQFIRKQRRESVDSSFFGHTRPASRNSKTVILAGTYAGENGELLVDSNTVRFIPAGGRLYWDSLYVEETGYFYRLESRGRFYEIMRYSGTRQ